MKYNNLSALKLATKRILLIFVFWGSISAPVLLRAELVETMKLSNEEKKIFEIGLEIKLNNSSSIYNSDFEEQVKDTLFYKDEEKDEILLYPYTTGMSQQIYTLNFIYRNSFFNNLMSCFNIKFPFVNTSIEEKFVYDSLDYSRRYTKNKDSYFSLVGTELEVSLAEFEFKPVSLNLFASVFVPFYKYKEISDSTNEIINNKQIELGRCFETKYGADIELKLKTVNLALTSIYENRIGDFSDRILTNLHFGFSSVNQTELYLNLDYVTSLGDYKNTYKISQWRSVLWEKYFDVGVGFNIFFTDYFFTEIAYNIRLWGENTIAKNAVKINLKYKFNF